MRVRSPDVCAHQCLYIWNVLPKGGHAGNKGAGFARQSHREANEFVKYRILYKSTDFRTSRCRKVQKCPSGRQLKSVPCPSCSPLEHMRYFIPDRSMLRQVLEGQELDERQYGDDAWGWWWHSAWEKTWTTTWNKPYDSGMYDFSCTVLVSLH